jgi:hypothetical protein
MAVFTIAIFSSASLLFVVQPMVGKLLLPKLGGAPAVWNTCMMFFQATLLAGYLSAHLLTRYVKIHWQIGLFVGGLCLAFTTLPLSIDPRSVESLVNGAAPNSWLMGVLIRRVAPVFFMLSITSPLLQHWFGTLGHPRGHDPYFLYSASNIGSILSLLLFPFFLEVSWGVAELTQGWTWGFGLFIGLAATCGALSLRNLNSSQSRRSSLVPSDVSVPSAIVAPITWTRRTYWVVLSLIPSSLMLGVTTYISTDVSSVPLIWIIPLTIYLFTFVFAFARKQWFTSYWMGRIAALLIVTITVTVITGGNDPPCVIVPLHLLMFSAVAMFCHQRLANDRPESSRLTEFYLCMSIGGVLGGLCNAIVAPTLFSTIFEYPLMMFIATLFRETRADDKTQERSPYAADSGDFFVAERREPSGAVRENLEEPDGSRRSASKVSGNERSSFGLIGFGCAIFAMVLGLLYLVDHLVPADWIESIAKSVSLPKVQVETLLCFGPPACWLFSQLERKISFSVGLGAMLLVSVWNRSTDDRVLHQDRNFYGTLATNRDSLGEQVILRMVHGNTVHGCQWQDESKRNVPLTYYGVHSGVSQLIHARQSLSHQPLRIGAVGLGAGSLAAWCRPGDTIVYYEINPLVVEHAEKYFNYLSDARTRGVKVEIRTGDARLLLESEVHSVNSRPYDLLLVDAFSSDSIPVHLITREACAVYRESLKTDGVISFHISNRFLDLEPVLAALARQGNWLGYRYDFKDVSGNKGIDEKTGETASSWVMMTRETVHLGSMIDDAKLRPLQGNIQHRIWTDDYSNLLSVLVNRL